MRTDDAPELLRFRDPERARALARVIAGHAAALPGPVVIMHVCGSHEQVLARFGLRALLPRSVELVMGPGCPVCVTAAAEVDQAVALARRGVRVCTFGDMLRLPGTSGALDDARAEGAPVEVVYGPDDVIRRARDTDEEVVFLASGFETTAVTTAAMLLAGLPDNLSVLSVHKWVPAAMEVVAALPDSRIAGFLAAGHAAAVTGYGLFEPFAERSGAPVAVAGFEPLDILAALALVLGRLREGRPGVVNAYPRCVTRHGNRRALEALHGAYEAGTGPWRGLGAVPGGNLRLRFELRRMDARHRFDLPPPQADAADAVATVAMEARSGASAGSPAPAERCRCGEIMTGRARPTDCPLFGRSCTPDRPMGACMVSTEGTCRIWHAWGGAPDHPVEVA